MADVRIAIEDMGESINEERHSEVVSGRKVTTISVAAVAFVSLAAIAGWLGFQSVNRTEPASSMAVHIRTLDSMPENRGAKQIAVSPDGAHIVYVIGDNLSRSLVHRRLDRFESRIVPDSTNARFPFFSPDSQWFGFTAGDTLKKASVQGGQPVDLVGNIGVGGRASWSPAGDEIVFTRDRTNSLWRVSAEGGEPSAFWHPDSGPLGYVRPSFLPDGKSLLVEIGDREAIGLFDLETLELETILGHGSNPTFAPSGHLVFARGSSLYAVAFDSTRRLLSGEPVEVLVGVSHMIGCAQFSFSENGLLAYVESNLASWESADRSLVLVDREGTLTPLSDRKDAFVSPSISPDGTRVAVAANGRIWVFETTTETWQLLTSVSDGYANYPVWSHTGEEIVFVRGRGPEWLYAPYSTASDFSGSAKRILDHGVTAIPRSVSLSGQLVFCEVHSSEQRNILMLPSGSELPEYVVRSQHNETDPYLSPQGQWLAYTSDRSGVNEVYVEPFPGGGPRVQVSTQGGHSPRWAPDESELFYRNDAQMIAVPVTTEPGFSIKGDRQVLFEIDALENVGYDVGKNGQWFLMVLKGADEQREDRSRQHVNLIFNWFEELNRLAPSD